MHHKLADERDQRLHKINPINKVLDEDMDFKGPLGIFCICVFGPICVGSIGLLFVPRNLNRVKF